MAAISNEEQLIHLLWNQGHSESEIAETMDIDEDRVHDYLERLERDD